MRRDDLGSRIRQLRVERGLTQAQLASPHYTHAHVSTIESGRRQPSQAALEHIASKLNVDFDELSTGVPAGLAEELRLDLLGVRQELSVNKVPQALRKAREVRKRAADVSFTRIESEAVALQGAAAEITGDLDEALRTYVEAESLLRPEAPTARAKAVSGQVRCLIELGEVRHAIYVGERYLEELSQEDMASPDARVRVLTPLILAYHVTKLDDQAAKAAEECERLAPKVSDASAVASMYVGIAAAQFSRQMFRDADLSLSKAEDLFEEVRFERDLGIAHLAHGCVLARTKAVKRARDHLDKAVQILGDNGDTVQRANALMELARLERLAGKDQLAADGLAVALNEIGSEGPLRLRAWAHREMGLALAASHPKDSEKELMLATELFESEGLPVEVARTYLYLFELQIQGEEVSAAIHASRAAAEALESVPGL